jgi:spermidine synthase
MSEFKWWHERSDGHGITTSVEVKLLHSEQSSYQLIEIYDHQSFGRLLVLDGYIQASQADEFIYHEMAVHVPLLGRERKDASVLVIGGGEGGIVRESLKHDFVTSVTMVEIDQRVVDLASEYLAVNGDYKDPRVTLIIDNAANFVSQAVKDGKRFDLIVLDLTEPVGPSSCLFTEKFLTEVVSLVSETGVILDSDSIYLSKKGGDFLQEVSGEGDNLVTVMQRTKILPHIDVYHTNIPLYPGADFGFFLYSRDGVSLRHPVKPFEGKHYNAEVHTASFALPNWQKEWLMPKG